MSKPKNLALYFKGNCPFCRKVLDYLEDLNKTVQKKDVKGNPENLEDLKRISNKTQVPCLIIDGDPLLESDAIILWLEEHQNYLKDAHKGKF